jgi:hypothetical protein
MFGQSHSMWETHLHCNDGLMLFSSCYRLQGVHDRLDDETSIEIIVFLPFQATSQADPESPARGGSET